MDIPLLRKDECEPLTTEQMNDIKSQFNPSNTANVNIVPYHIYDEDGEEIVVGEVRKTIDGVKKCKPVYEKIIIVNSKTTSIDISSSNADEVYDAYGFYFDAGGGMFNIDRTATSFDWQSGLYVSSTKTGVTIFYGSKVTCAGVKLTIRYSKTTDDWQPV